MSERVFAPAKLNLSLRVGAARADGRHELFSIVAFADVGDWVRAEPADGLRLQLEGRFADALAGERDNLVLRAARALADAAGKQDAGALLTLDKQLPVASGIGGGSSDAAATLKALNALWGLNAAQGELMAIAARLGSDVPACLEARALLMRGAGDEVEPIRLPALDAVLVNPLVPVSTAAVYRQFDAMGLGGPIGALAAPRWGDAEAALAALGELHNDLAAPARALAPVIGEVEALLGADARARVVRVSGSGASVFALTASAADAQALAEAVRAARPNWWTSAARLGAA